MKAVKERRIVSENEQIWNLKEIYKIGTKSKSIENFYETTTKKQQTHLERHKHKNKIYF